MKKYFWTLQGNYGFGWQDLTSEETREEIKERLKEYQENERGKYRIKREKEELIPCQK